MEFEWDEAKNLSALATLPGRVPAEVRVAGDGELQEPEVMTEAVDGAGGAFGGGHRTH